MDASLSNSNYILSSPRLQPRIQIISQPTDVETSVGFHITISANVETELAPQFQWYDEKGRRILAKCQNSLTLGPMRERDFGFYRLLVGNGSTDETVLTRWVEVRKSHFNNRIPQHGHLQANRSELRVVEPLKGGCFRQGWNISQTAHFENATYYQWYKDGVELKGCIGNTLHIRNVNSGNSGLYALQASNSQCCSVNTFCNITVY